MVRIIFSEANFTPASPCVIYALVVGHSRGSPHERLHYLVYPILVPRTAPPYYLARRHTALMHFLDDSECHIQRCPAAKLYLPINSSTHLAFAYLSPLTCSCRAVHVPDRRGLARLTRGGPPGKLPRSTSSGQVGKRSATRHSSHGRRGRRMLTAGTTPPGFSREMDLGIAAPIGLCQDPMGLCQEM